MKVTSIGGALGARVSAVSLGSLSEAETAEIRAALLRHQVLFVVDQPVDGDVLAGFASLWGPLSRLALDGSSTALELVKPDNLYVGKLGSDRRADKWHTDFTYRESPNVATLLQAVTVPAAGGDTMWSSLTAAYEHLSPRMKQYLQGLTAFHDGAIVGEDDSTAVHPVVRVHPDTGAPVLYVNRHYTTRIMDMARRESEALLSYLFAQVEEPHFTCRWQWSDGDVCIWDNRCTLHLAINDYGRDVVRDHYHVSVLGDDPQPYLGDLDAADEITGRPTAMPVA